LSEEEQIKKLENIALSTADTGIQKRVIDTLGTQYDRKAIPAILKIAEKSRKTEISTPLVESVYDHAMKTIDKINESKK